jgi:hypothetical protein
MRLRQRDLVPSAHELIEPSEFISTLVRQVVALPTGFDIGLVRGS